MPVYVNSWRDCPFVLDQDAPNVPAMALVSALSGYHERRWQIGDRMFGRAHIQHDYVPGTAIYLHMHWLSTGVSLLPVAWEWAIWHAKGHNQAAFDLDTPGTVIAAQEVSGGRYQHMITESAPITIAGLEPDSYVLARIRRIANGGTDNADPIFAWHSDIHHEVSVQGTKNRAPPFYE